MTLYKAVIMSEYPLHHTSKNVRIQASNNVRIRRGRAFRTGMVGFYFLLPLPPRFYVLPVEKNGDLW